MMVNDPEVPVSDPPVDRVAVTVCDEPARSSVIACEDSTPEVKAAVVVEVPDEIREVEVRSTVPVKFRTVRLPESCAVIFTLNDVPATWVPRAASPVVVTAK